MTWTNKISILLVIALVINIYLFVLFLNKIKSIEPQNHRLIESLSRFLLSGSGGIREDSDAIKYFIKRRYTEFNNKEVTRLGDRALVGWYILGIILLATAITAAIENP